MPRFDSRFALAGALLLLAPASLHAGGHRIVHTEQVPVKRIVARDLDGGNRTVLVDALASTPLHLDRDASTGRLLWVANFEWSIMSCAHDGSNVAMVRPPTAFGINAIAAHPFSGVIFFAEGPRLRRMDADGGNDVELVHIYDLGSATILSIAVDGVNDHVYFGTSLAATGPIFRMNLDGTGITTVLPNERADDLQLDVPAGRLYWAKQAPGAIYRANLDGSGAEPLLAAGCNLRTIALEPEGGHIYWTYQCNPESIRRVDLDGGNPIVLVEPPYAAGDAIITPATVGGGCAADLDGGGDVSFGDLVGLLSSWGPCTGCPADLDGDGTVGFDDLVAMLAAWGPCP